MLVKSIKIFLLLIFLLIACDSPKIDDDTLVKIFVEKLIIDETYFKDQKLLEEKKLLLFKKYKISEIEFENILKEKSFTQKEITKFFLKCNKLLSDLKNSGAIN